LACPPTLIAAAKMFVAHLYANREQIAAEGVEGELPLGFRALCNMYRMPVL